MNYDKIFGIITNSSEKIKLTPNENFIFGYIYDKKRVTIEELCNCICNNKLKLFSRGTIATHITRINKKIKSIGKIENINRYGYEFIERKDKNE